MGYKFTDCGKWNDAWFSSQSIEGKLLWHYICDACHHCGYMEVVVKTISIQTDIDKDRILDVLRGFGDRIIWSTDGHSIVIVNHIKHQKNLPLNPNVNAHKGIVRKWEEVSHKFPGYVLRDDEGIRKGSGRDGEGIAKGWGRDKEGIRNPSQRDQEGIMIPSGKGKGNLGKGGVGEKPFYSQTPADPDDPAQRRKIWNQSTAPDPRNAHIDPEILRRRGIPVKDDKDKPLNDND